MSYYGGYSSDEHSFGIRGRSAPTRRGVDRNDSDDSIGYGGGFYGKSPSSGGRDMTRAEPRSRGLARNNSNDGGYAGSKFYGDDSDSEYGRAAPTSRGLARNESSEYGASRFYGDRREESRGRSAPCSRGVSREVSQDSGYNGWAVYGDSDSDRDLRRLVPQTRGISRAISDASTISEDSEGYLPRSMSSDYTRAAPPTRGLARDISADYSGAVYGGDSEDEWRVVSPGHPTFGSSGNADSALSRPSRKASDTEPEPYGSRYGSEDDSDYRLRNNGRINRPNRYRGGDDFLQKMAKSPAIQALNDRRHDYEKTDSERMLSERMKSSGKALPSALKKKKSDISPDDYYQSLLKSFGFRPGSSFPCLSLVGFFDPVTPECTAAYTPDVVRAVRLGDIVSLRELSRSGHPMHCCNKFGESLVHNACRSGDDAVLKFLLDHGASVRVRCENGRTPLHDACWTSTTPNFKLVKMLIKECPDFLLITDSRGFTPLAYTHRDTWKDWRDFLSKNAENMMPRELL